MKPLEIGTRTDRTTTGGHSFGLPDAVATNIFARTVGLHLNSLIIVADGGDCGDANPAKEVAKVLGWYNNEAEQAYALWQLGKEVGATFAQAATETDAHHAYSGLIAIARKTLPENTSWLAYDDNVIDKLAEIAAKEIESQNSPSPIQHSYAGLEGLLAMLASNAMVGSDDDDDD